MATKKHIHTTRSCYRRLSHSSSRNKLNRRFFTKHNRKYKNKYNHNSKQTRKNGGVVRYINRPDENFIKLYNENTADTYTYKKDGKQITGYKRNINIIRNQLILLYLVVTGKFDDILKLSVNFRHSNKKNVYTNIRDSYEEYKRSINSNVLQNIDSNNDYESTSLLENDETKIQENNYTDEQALTLKCVYFIFEDIFSKGLIEIEDEQNITAFHYLITKELFYKTTGTFGKFVTYPIKKLNTSRILPDAFIDAIINYFSELKRDDISILANMVFKQYNFLSGKGIIGSKYCKLINYHLEKYKNNSKFYDFLKEFSNALNCNPPSNYRDDNINSPF